MRPSYRTIAIIELRIDGCLVQECSSGEKLADLSCILKVEPTEAADVIDVRV